MRHSEKCESFCLARTRRPLRSGVFIVIIFTTINMKKVILFFLDLVPEGLTIGVEVLMTDFHFSRLTCTQVGSAVLQTRTAIRTQLTVAAGCLRYFWGKEVEM